jgi:catechol 2,3-dioxygenase
MSLSAAATDAIRFAPRRATHVTLFVGDHDRSRAFYHQVCGFEPVYYEEPVELSLFSNGSSHHDLAILPIKYQSATCDAMAGTPGLNHVAWEMDTEKDLVAAYNRAIDAGLPIQRALTHTVSHSVYVFDPDGNSHEFYSDAMENWRTTYHGGSGGSVTSPWDPNAAPADTRQLYPAGDDIRRVETAALHPRRLSHLVFVTGDHDEMIDFCTEVAGLEIAHESSDGGLVCMASARASYPCSLALVKGGGDMAPGFHHASYEIADERDLAAAEAALVADGIAIERRVDNGGKHSLFVRDPDGIRFEYTVARSPDFGAAASASPAERLYLV